MNFLSNLFADEAYKAYLDEEPTPNAAVVAGAAATRQLVADGIRQSCGTQTRMRLQTFASIEQIHTKKAPRGSYEGHKATSVLKRNWCLKHQQRIFGCVAVLMDWDNLKMTDRMQFEQAVSSQFEPIRSTLRTSVNTRLILVLTTKNLSSADPPPCSTFATTEEALVALRNKLGLDSKSLCVVYREGVDEYSIGRLQRIIFEQCVKYHRDEIQKIKRMKGDAPRSTNPLYLQARLRFKAGWHCLVLQDYKLMKHNLEKGYTLLWQSASMNPANVSFDDRVAATVILWTMIASNCNQLIGGAGTKLEVVLSMLEETVDAFLSHLARVAAPFSVAALAGIEKDGVLLLQSMQQIFMAEWYQLLAEKISKVLSSHRVVPRLSQLRICPGVYFRSAVEYWGKVRQSLSKQKQLAQESIVALPPTFVAVEYSTTPTVYYKLFLTSTSVESASNTMFLLLQQGLRHVVAAGLPRLTVEFLYATGEHFFFVEDYRACFEKLQNILSQADRSATSATFMLADTVLCAVHKLMVQTCRRLSRVGVSSSSPEACSVDEQSNYLARVRHQLVCSMLALMNNPLLDKNAQGVIMAELGRNIREKSVDVESQPYHIPQSANVEERSIVSCTAFFTSPFAEAHNAKERRANLIVSFSTKSQLALTLTAPKITLGKVTCTGSAAPNNGSFSLLGHKPVYAVGPVDTEVQQQVDKIVGKLPSTFVVLSGKPAFLTIPVIFPSTGLFEVATILTSWEIPNAEGESSSLPLIVKFDNTDLYRRFDWFAYDASSLEAGSPLLRYRDPTRRHRPVVRVVRPIAPVSIAVEQSQHAIEGESYEVTIVLENNGPHDILPGDANIYLTFLQDVVEVLDNSLESATIDGMFSDVTGIEFIKPFTPEGYDMSQFTILGNGIAAGGTFRKTFLLLCKKGGKFELPVRVHFKSPLCDDFMLSTLLTIHVCHPVFVTYTVRGSHDVRHERQSPQVIATIPSDALSAQFIESSVLREIAPTNDIDDEFNSLLIPGGIENFGKMLRADPYLAKSAVDALNTVPTPLQHIIFSNMQYSVERTQVPTDAKKLLSPELQYVCGSTIFLTSKLSNSLQFPLDIERIEVQVSDPHVKLVSLGSLSQQEPSSTLCALSVDEEYSFTIALLPLRPGTQRSLGSMVLHLRRGATSAQSQQPNTNPLFTFELPLPTVDLKSCACRGLVEYPDGPIGCGDTFLASVVVTNNGDQTSRVEVVVGSSNIGDTILAAGRTRWSFMLPPKETRKTTIKLIAIVAGRAVLPSVTATADGELIVRSDDNRIVQIVPAGQIC